MFMHDGVCLVNLTIDSITNAYTQTLTNLGAMKTGKFPVHTPPPPSVSVRTAPPPSPPSPPGASAEVDDVWADAGARGKRGPELEFPYAR